MCSTGAASGDTAFWPDGGAIPAFLRDTSIWTWFCPSTLPRGALPAGSGQLCFDVQVPTARPHAMFWPFLGLLPAPARRPRCRPAGARPPLL